MTLKNLVVQVDSSKANDARLDLALGIAQHYNSHLVGSYTIPSLNPVIYADGSALSGVYQSALDAIESDTLKAESKFLDKAKQANLDHEWSAHDGRAVDNLTLVGRYADLCIVGQDAPEALLVGEDDVAENVATALGKPVLVVPYVGAPAQTGKRILIAWDASRESARAVHDAMPLLANADQLDVLHMYDKRAEDDGPQVARQLCGALARNDIKARPHELLVDDIEVGDALLSRAADFGSDMIVMGAYGHSRFRELVLGGATRDVLHHMTVPVLMAH